MTTDFNALQTRLESYDASMVLGQLCWFSIPEVLIDHSLVVREMTATGLDRLGLPPVPRSSDVFKRACTAAVRRKVPTNDPNVISNYLLREVGKDREMIWRKIVKETVDSSGRKLGYIEIVELQFDRQRNAISESWNPDADIVVIHPGTIPVSTLTTSTAMVTAKHHDAIALEMVADVRKNFSEWNNSLAPASLRELVRKILVRMYATAVRPSGGVYFVQEEWRDQLGALEQLINKLPGCSFHTLPLLDDRKQREMLKKAFEDESIEEIDRILGDIITITSNDQKISPDRYANIASEYNRLQAKGVEYAKLLDSAMTETNSRLYLFQEAIVSLMNNVK